MRHINHNSDNEEFKEIINILFEEIKNLKKETKTPAKLLTFEEAMDILRLHKSKLYDMVGRQEIPCIRIDRIIRFDREDLRKFIDNKKTEEFKFEFNENGIKGSKYQKK